jgi:transcriptional regulator with XRE-family HTH domain
MLAHNVVPLRRHTTTPVPIRPACDPLLPFVLDALEGHSPETIAEKSGLSAQTIRNWRQGRTKYPQAISMEFALRAVGYKLAVVKA